MKPHEAPGGDAPLTGGRNNPNSHGEESARFRIGFFAPLGEWLSQRRAGSPTGRVLDFGCGDLLLARLLDGVWLVDGYDESALARASARATQARLDEPGEVYDELASVPEGAYDAVVVNSLFQYVPSIAEAAALFRTLRPLLAPDATVGIVITDAVSDRPNRLVDLIDVLRYNLAVCGPSRTIQATFEGIRSGRPSTRHQLLEGELRPAAAAAGLSLERLPRGLTRFTRRATFVLRHQTSAPIDPETYG